MRTRMRFALAAAVSAVLAIAGPLSVSAHSAPSPSGGPALAPLTTSTSPKAIPGQYIVTLKAGQSPAVTAQQVPGVKPLFTYNRVFSGYAAKLTAAQLDSVRKLPGVATVEQDATVTVGPVQARGAAARGVAYSWGQDRVDQPYLPLNSQFNVNGDGKGATAYILDTGLEFGHAEFDGRARPGFDAIGDGRSGADCNGHGTHVGGTVAGGRYGVARGASLVSVRVLNCQGSGSWSGIIAGLDWVAQNAVQPAVLNGSLGGPRNTAVNNAATALAARGVLPVFAAGNDAINACNVSPASAADVLTVGATNHLDEETDFSNFGACLDLYAPGAAIISARLGGDSIALNGTSMAAPHVAGVAVLARAQTPSATPAAIATWITDHTVRGELVVSGGSPNRLLQTGGL
ncbi:S8 family peptidase [Streptomyces sp. NPDC059567]|uniref:S8 family peptidase n=1 Tax=Streptomyces sp. NPDC059567 TaxID=3346867 RepID=UPI0036ADFF14